MVRARYRSAPIPSLERGAPVAFATMACSRPRSSRAKPSATDNSSLLLLQPPSLGHLGGDAGRHHAVAGALGLGVAPVVDVVGVDRALLVGEDVAQVVDREPALAQRQQARNHLAIDRTVGQVAD